MLPVIGSSQFIQAHVVRVLSVTCLDYERDRAVAYNFKTKMFGVGNMSRTGFQELSPGIGDTRDASRDRSVSSNVVTVRGRRADGC